MLGSLDAIDPPPRRILVAGTTGVGKTTTAGRIGAALGVPHTEIDSLYTARDGRLVRRSQPRWSPTPALRHG